MTLTELLTLNKKVCREEIIATMNNEIELLQGQIDEGNDSIGIMGGRLEDLKKDMSMISVMNRMNEGSYNKLMSYSRHRVLSRPLCACTTCRNMSNTGIRRL